MNKENDVYQIGTKNCLIKGWFPRTEIMKCNFHYIDIKALSTIGLCISSSRRDTFVAFLILIEMFLRDFVGLTEFSEIFLSTDRILCIACKTFLDLNFYMRRPSFPSIFF